MLQTNGMNIKVSPKFLFLIYSLSALLLSRSGLAFWRDIPQTPLPTLQNLEEIALRYAGLDPQRIADWEHDARWAPALPRLQVGWESNLINQNTTVIQDSVSVTSSGVNIGPASNRLDADFSNNQGMEVRALWELREVLFNPDQILISREARDLYVFRSRLREELQQAYFTLKETLQQLQNFPQAKRDPYLQIKVEQAIAKLDSLTGGEFSKLWQGDTSTSQSPTLFHSVRKAQK